MKLRQTATALTIGSFSVVSFTGVLLFADSGIGGIRATHEWIGILFVGFGLMHMLTHKKAFFRYFKTSSILLIVVVILTGGVIFSSSFDDIYSSARALELLSNTDIKTLSTVLKQDSGFVADQLRSAGLTLGQNTMSMIEIAETNQIDIHDVMDLLFQDKVK